ncbi:MAG: sulfur carrier protein ThiS [Casimicrobiaceae bacterium]
MRITVNGAARELPPALTVAGLITVLGLEGRRIAVERNGDILPRSRHAETRLVDGDAFEIVAAVGGG